MEIKFKTTPWGQDNEQYSVKEGYKPEEVLVRTYDGETDSYKTKKVKVNLEQEWDTKVQLTRDFAEFNIKNINKEDLK